MKSATIKYNVSFDTIKTWLKKGVNPYGEKCYLFGNDPKEYNGRYNKGSSMAITYKGQMYEAQKDLAKAIKATETITTATTEVKTTTLDYYVLVDKGCVLGTPSVITKSISILNSGIGTTISNVVFNVEKVV